MDSALTRGPNARSSAAFIAAIAGLLTLIGFLHVMTATLVPALEEGRTFSRMVVKQAITVLIAVGVGLFCARTDYRRLVACSKYFLIIVWLGLLAVLAVGDRVLGAKRWIDLGFFSLQVSELAKLGVILAAARYVTLRQDRLDSYREGFLPAMLWLMPTVLLVAAEPDFGTSMFLLAMGLILLFLGGTRLSHIIMTGVVMLPVFLVVMLSRFGHISDRLNSFKDGVHPQVLSALRVMAMGGKTGVGLGEGRAQLKFVPFIESDFIFASVGEQLGLLGSIGIIALFAMFFWHGLKITLRARDRAGFLVAFGLTFMVVFQAGINMAVVTGLVPPKGIGLPFVSYGGSSLMMLGATVGILVSIARRGVDGDLSEAVPAPVQEDSALRDPELEEA